MTPEEGPAIQARQLTKDFEPDGPLAVDHLDLDVHAGEVYALLGANGSGKSTAVGMLATLIRPTSGSASILGMDVARRAPQVRARIGLALQEAGLDRASTPRRLLLLHSSLLGASASQAAVRTAELLAELDVGDLADRTIGKLSGGNRRRVDLALALVGRPEVIFLDEPTTGLDPLSRTALWGLVEQLAAAGTTVLLTTQNMEEADRLADRVGILAAGQIRTQGTPGQLKALVGGDVLAIDVDDGAQEKAATVLAARTEGDRRVRLATPPGGAGVPAAITLLAAEGIAVHGVTLTAPTLDDVFAAVVGGGTADGADAASGTGE